MEKTGHLLISPSLEIRDQDMGDAMVLVESEEEVVEEERIPEEERIVAEEEEEANEREELPKIFKHGRIHRVTALVNGNMEEMEHELQVLHGEPFFLKSTLLGCGELPSMKPRSGESVFCFF